MTALWPVLISRPAEDRRLSWPESTFTRVIGSAEVMSDDSEDVHVPSRDSSYVSHVVDELISTERAYVRDLRDVVRVSLMLVLLSK